MSDSIQLLPGDLVVEEATGQRGIVEWVDLDNSCSDPDCCGGPFPDTAWVRLACGHVLDESSDRGGVWSGFRLVAHGPAPFVGGHVPTPGVVESLEDLQFVLQGTPIDELVIELDRSGAGIVLAHPTRGQIARLSHAAASGGGVSDMLQRLPHYELVGTGTLPEAPLRAPLAEGTLVRCRATGLSGSVVSSDADIAQVRFECGHIEALLAFDGVFHELTRLFAESHP